MSKPALLLVVNPRARRAGNPGWEQRVLTVLTDRFAVDVVRTRSVDEASEVIPERVARGVAAVVAAGGDGTLQGVAQALAGSGVAVGLIPLGTGNDFARQHGIPTAPAAAAERIVRGRRAEVDLVTANGRRFVTVGGLGVVTDVALTANRMREGTGLAARASRAIGTGVYRFAASATVLAGSLPTRRYGIRGYEGSTREAIDLSFDGHGLFVANQRFLGAGIALPGDISPHDGAFELFRVHTTSRVKLMGALTSLLRRAPVDPAILSVHRMVSARIVADRGDTFLGDGDPMAAGREFDITVDARALSVFA